jgi:hypothetical protein
MRKVNEFCVYERLTPRWKPITVKGKPVSQTIVEDRDGRA